MSWRLADNVDRPSLVVAPDLHGAKLGPRLASLAELVPRDARVADIGTDHGLLPVALAKTGRVAHAIGIDVNAAPLIGAERNRRLAGAPATIELRCGDGLAPLKPGEVDTVIIAGMGGPTMAEILAAHPPRELGIKRFVLQPFKGASHARRALMESGFRIVSEEFVCEGRRFFLNIAAELGDEAYDEAALFLGPCLLQARPPLYETWLAIQKAWLEEQLAGQGDAPDESTRQRYEWVLSASSDAA